MPDPDGRWGSQEASASRPADALRELGEPAQLKETLENEMSALPEVSEINTTTGREDLLVRPATESHASLQELIERLLSISGVTRATTSPALSNPLSRGRKMGPVDATAETRVTPPRPAAGAAS